MTKTLVALDHSTAFPEPEQALDEPNGLLAIGGDLAPERLINAYRHGIFPWYGNNDPLLWWSPDPRGVLFIDDYQPSSSLRKFIRKTDLTVTLNHRFTEVVEACAKIPRHDSGTWITEEMQQAYIRLHQHGYAHSVEVWQNQKLVGGLYGVGVGRLFCGESMFHRRSNASKLAFFALCQHLRAQGFAMIDCQMQNPHLASLGVVEISRHDFLAKLAEYRGQTVPEACWLPQSLAFNKG